MERLTLYRSTACAAPAAELGEGPCWDSRTGSLYWVDIDSSTIRRLNPYSGNVDIIAAPERTSAVIPLASGEWIVAAYHSLYKWEPGADKFEELARLELPSHIRFNDGKAGPDGALWIGTMNMRDNVPEGALYRIDSSLTPVEAIGGVHCSNGLDWSLDRSEMYYIDSGIREVRAYQFDANTGRLGTVRQAVAISDNFTGVPDGMSLDADGMIWVALWGGHRVARWNPVDGSLLGYVETAAEQPSSCAFGGPDYATLYITSALSGLDPDRRSKQPLAGMLFHVSEGLNGIRGREPFRLNWNEV